jgi:hypothetical protein
VRVSASPGRLHPDDLAVIVERTAERVVELLGGNHPAVPLPTSPAGVFPTAKETALRFAVTRAWVYAHADELGAIRLGRGAEVG